MNIFQSPLRQMLSRVAVQAASHMATFLLALILIVAWVLTSPLFQLSDHITEWGKWKRKKSALTKEGYKPAVL